MKIKSIINFIHNYKIILGLNYHRIGQKNLDNPFKGLHSVSFTIFKIQVLFLKFFFNILSLDDIEAGKVDKKINFFITFDDVPNESKKAFEWLHKKKIPFTICPNISIIENKYTIGDKVRYINNLIDKNKIKEDFENLLNETNLNILKKIGFKKFYKSYEIDYENFIKAFDIFFKKFERDFKKYKDKQNYLDWKDVIDLSLKCSVACHGKNHNDYFHLNYNEIYQEMKESKKQFENKLNKNIKIFAVPYGAYEQNLGIMLNQAAKKLGYKQILWAGNQGIVFTGKKNHQIQNFPRINAPSNLYMFVKTLVYSFTQSSIILKNNKHLKYSYNKKFKSLDISVDESKDQIAAFENTIRPEKDYSSNEIFIENIYINNPFRKSRPYIFTVKRNNILNAVHYNLYKEYKFDKTFCTILESSAWRKLDTVPPNMNSTLLLKALRTCKSIYSWRPSSYLAPGYKKNTDFFSINNTEFIFESKDYNYENKEILSITDYCPKDISNFLEKFNQKFYFTLNRSVDFYKWRIDQYPIGKKKYFIKKNKNEISSILICQIFKKKALIVDLVSNDIEESTMMIKFFLGFCKKNNILSVKFSISNKKLTDKIKEEITCKYNNFESFIYIKKLVNEKIIERKFLNEETTYETYICGDVLIR